MSTGIFKEDKSHLNIILYPKFKVGDIVKTTKPFWLLNYFTHVGMDFKAETIGRVVGKDFYGFSLCKFGDAYWRNMCDTDIEKIGDI